MDSRVQADRVTIRFYRRAGDVRTEAPAGWPGTYEIKSWRPASDGPPPWGPDVIENLAWFALDRLGLFATRDFEELGVWRDGRRLLRLIVTPRWARFPFMEAGDLQIGGLWTEHKARRRGLAAAAIGEAHRRHAAPGRRFWYLVDEDNIASLGLAEACGYRIVGSGRRTSPLGLRALGRFVMAP